MFSSVFRLMPEEATVDEDGVQLGGKRAAILYAHRLRQAEAEAAKAAAAAEAAPPVADAGEEEVAAKADAEADGGEEKESIVLAYEFEKAFSWYEWHIWLEPGTYVPGVGGETMKYRLQPCAFHLRSILS